MKNFLIVCEPTLFSIVHHFMASHCDYMKRLGLLKISMVSSLTEAQEILHAKRFGKGDAVLVAVKLGVLTQPAEKDQAAMLIDLLEENGNVPFAQFHLGNNGEGVCPSCVTKGLSYLAYKLFPHPHHE